MSGSSAALRTPQGALLLLAIAVLCWPGSRPTWRLRRPHGDRVSPVRFRAVAHSASLPVAMVIGAVLAGIGGACGATALAVVGSRYWHSRREARRRLTHATAFFRGIRLLVAELRAGAHPVAAVEGAAVDAPAEVRGLFRDLAATTRLGAEITTVLNRRHPAYLHASVGRLVRAWALAQRHGVALADLLDAVGRDVEHWSAYLRDREAKMAGPRATAAVLSGLPLLGLLLGEAVGAGPVAVLTGTLVGQAVLIIGIGLLCVGVLWTMRLTEAGVRW